MSLGFGSAGSEIITNALISEGDLNPMLPGKKKYAIFGFCDIRNFTDVTEVLTKDILLFVNKIAEIVHTVVEEFKGNANKNIGDAFLLVWKLPFYDENSYNVHPHTRISADLSLMSFIKIIAKIKYDKELKSYSNNDKILQRIPNYKVRMGFGLHIGWGIEGAIGSEFKIDASYLSPNVNLASRLEAATKQFGKEILISGSLVNIMSADLKEKCRKIDIVTVKGSIKPIELYTVDLILDRNTRSTNFDIIDKHQLKRKKRKDNVNVKATYIIEPNMPDLVKNALNNLIKLEHDIEIKSILNVDEVFKDKFQSGFDNYILGNWEISKTTFEGILSSCNDTPSEVLLNFIQKYNYKAPDDWKGYRELTEK